MTSRRFEFKEGSSNKFWEITLEGARVTTTYGKIGTSGQTTLKASPTAAAAQKVYDALIKEKTKKGYVEVAAKQAAPEPEPEAPAEQTNEELLDLAMDLTDGSTDVQSLEGRARKLAGPAKDRFAAAARLFAAIPPRTKHSTLSKVEVDGRRAAAAYFAKDLKTAKAVLGSYKKLSEFDAHWLYDTLLNTDDLDEAVEVASFVLSVHPNHARALKVMAVSSIEAGRPREAVPFLTRALKANPTYASGWYNLACAWSKAGEKKHMLVALGQAITHGKTTTMTDYTKTALGDADFEAWLDDPDFIALVRPNASTPGAEKLESLYDRESYDEVLAEAAKAMAKTPANAKLLARLARKATKAVVGDLEEHGDANADDYGLGGVREYKALDATLKTVEAKGDAASVKAFAALLKKLS